MSKTQARTHRCAAVGCKLEIPVHRLFCKHHFDLLPPPLRAGSVHACGSRSDAALNFLQAARGVLARKEGLWAS